MQIYLAALENSFSTIEAVCDTHSVKYGLISYYYLNPKHLEKLLDTCEYILVDSGAHSLQHGKKVDFDKYTEDYAQFIKENTDNPKFVGFFEMDIDNIVGYDKVKELRSKLEAVSDKIIPVWHNNRGIQDYHDMCKEYSGRRVSITGFRNGDIFDDQYNLFINTAHHYGCDIHILGMTRLTILKDLNLGPNDSCDSSSWAQTGIFGGINVLNGNEMFSKVDCFKGVKMHHSILKKMNLITYLHAQKCYDTMVEEREENV